MASGGVGRLVHVALVRGVLDEWPLAVLAALYTSLWFRGVLDEWPLAVLAALDTSKLPCWVV